jgi:endoglucanase
MPPRKTKKQARPAPKKAAPKKPPAKKAAARQAPAKKAKPAPKRPTGHAEAAAPAGPTPRAARAATAELVERLRLLCEAPGVSGDESAVRKVVLEAIAGHADEVRTDTMGNVFAVKRSGSERAPHVMVTAHMDEVGMMIVAADSDGHLRFDAVGGLDDRVLLGKPVLVGADRLPGVIGAKPVHLLKASEEEQVVKIDALRIDIGATSKEAALRKAKPGDRVTFAAPFSHVGDTVRARALDNRTGCAALVELLRGAPPGGYAFDLWAVFTVQEEIGLRGARVAAHTADPAAAFVLEGTVCDDLPKEEEASPTTEMGKGPAISVMDRTAIANRRLVDHLLATARELAIPCQIKQPGVGGTDAGSIHLARAGVPTVALAVPCRYIHAPLAMMSLADFQNEITLLRDALERFTPAVLKRRG